jgi:hypothetical protein
MSGTQKFFRKNVAGAAVTVTEHKNSDGEPTHYTLSIATIDDHKKYIKDLILDNLEHSGVKNYHRELDDGTIRFEHEANPTTGSDKHPITWNALKEAVEAAVLSISHSQDLDRRLAREEKKRAPRTIDQIKENIFHYLPAFDPQKNSEYGEEFRSLPTELDTFIDSVRAAGNYLKAAQPAKIDPNQYPKPFEDALNSGAPQWSQNMKNQLELDAFIDEYRKCHKTLIESFKELTNRACRAAGTQGTLWGNSPISGEGSALIRAIWEEEGINTQAVMDLSISRSG